MTPAMAEDEGARLDSAEEDGRSAICRTALV